MSSANYRIKFGLLLLAAVALLIMILAVGSNEANGKTITVDDDGNAEFESIQEAIDAAENGDTVRVWEGTYYENVVVNKSVSLVGNGSEETIIDGGGRGAVVNITIDYVNLSGFNVTGSKGYDAGIKIESDQNRIFDNNCSNNWYGIYLRYSDHNTLINNTCSSNDKRGIYLKLSNNNLLSNNTCITNDKSGIFLEFTEHNTFSGNTCLLNNDYGIFIGNSDNNQFSNNNCSGNENGIELEGSEYNNFSNNTCSMNFYNGICLGGSSDHITLINNTCSNNKYGIALGYSDYNTMVGNTIFHNIIGIRIRWSSLGNSAHHNNFSDNIQYGIHASDNNEYTINATDNWWDHVSGPYHDSTNLDGKGDNVTDHVDFDPWTDYPPFENYTPPEATIDSITPDLAIEGERIRFSGHGWNYTSIIVYAWRSSIDGEFYNGTDSEIECDELSKGTHTIYFKVQDDHGVWSEEVASILTIKELNLLITITKPSEGDTVNGTMLISGEVSPLSSEADSQILIRIDNGSWDESTGKAYYLNTCFWQLEWNSQSVENGQRTIFAKAYDGENWSNIAQIDVTVENQDSADLIPLPQWDVGDIWTWSYTVEVDGQSSSMTVTEEIKAKNIEETDNGTALAEPCYKLVAKTLILGETISTSTAYLSIITLKLLEEDFQGAGMPLFLYGFIAEIDWPLVITDGGPYQWSDAGEITVDAGRYSCYKLEGSSGPLYYSPEVKHIVKADMGEITFELKKGDPYGDLDDTSDDDGGEFIPGFDVIVVVGAVISCYGFYVNRKS